MIMLKEPQSGKQMNSSEARAYVDYLCSSVASGWREKIHNGSFMEQLRSGQLPVPVIRQFFRNWGRFSLEMSALNAFSYYTHLPFFVRNFDLLGPFCKKIGDALTSPRAPGHVLVLLQTAAALRLSRKEVLGDPSLPTARAINDFCHRIYIGGSLIELWGLHLFDETLSQWRAEWFTALTRHYGFTTEQTAYFARDETLQNSRGSEADSEGFNQTVLQRALENGPVEFRAGYSLEYCALTMLELQAQMKQAAMDHPYP